MFIIHTSVVSSLFSGTFANRNYPWAVYCEGPPSFIWRGEGWAKKRRHCYSSWHTYTNAHKTLFKSTVDIIYTFQRSTKHKKKLRRLAICAFICLQITKFEVSTAKSTLWQLLEVSKAIYKILHWGCMDKVKLVYHYSKSWKPTKYFYSGIKIYT